MKVGDVLMDLSIVQMKKKLDMVAIFFYIAILSGVVTNFAGVLPDSIKYLFYAISIVFGYHGIFLYIISKRKTAKSDHFLMLWLFLVLYMFILGFIRSNFYTNNFDVGIFLSTDVRYVMYITIGIIMANPKYISNYHQIMLKIGYLSIIFAVIALINYDFDIYRAQLGSRIGIWELPYYLWWLSGGVFSYLYPYSRLTGNNKIAGYGSLISYSVLGLLFLKRSAFINTIFILLITEYFLYDCVQGNAINAKKNIKFMLTVLMVFFVFVLLLQLPYFNVVITNLFARFMTQGNFFEYDRAYEATTYFEQVHFFDLILGQGLGHYVQTYRQINALHTGVYNTIYKGGIIYLIFILAICKNSIKAFIDRKELSTYSLICLCTSFSFLTSLLYEMSFTYTLVILGYATPITIVFNTKKEE